ncbi:hypothetical protein H6F67_25585 [Microcoleus sp. FACHB-1515]|uniref:hypothetical protein n=1 Tax=Cyanophyceae TaxID=3028117 RepID=UPI0016874B46|nr:hypothetical protein [Microcoleus sp. FACHB-1515]MBD2093220.1 hypothetical protein [Microcoleus sp. FACHB-1515]
MPKKVCGFGFDCGSMLLQPGLEPGECPNYTTCGRATRLTPDEEIELIRVRRVQREKRQRRSRQAQREQALRREVWRTTRRQIALEMLMQRGCPQTYRQYVPNETFEQLTEVIAQLQAQLAQFEGSYIPPEGTIAHRYWVHRGYASYPYNKLMARRAMFAPAQEEQAVRMIHLSRDDDPRNLEARKGITRMHRLVAIREQLQVAQAAVAEAIALATVTVEPFGVEQTETD